MIIIKTVGDRQSENVPPILISESNKVVTLSEMFAMDINHVPMLWNPFLSKHGISILAGSSDCGKSTFVRQLVSAICKGETSFLGYELSTSYQRGLIICTEDDLYGVNASLRKQLQGTEIDFGDRLTFMFDTEDLIENVENHLKTNQCDLVALDSWSDTLKSSPNDFTQVRSSIQPWNHLARKYGCSILLMHHTVKNSEKSTPDKNKLNGSQGIEAKARCLLELRQGSNRNERLLTVLKGNYISDEFKENSLTLSFDSDTLSFSNAGVVKKGALINTIGNKKEVYQLIKPEAIKLKAEKALSFSGLRAELAKVHGEEKTPSLTWLKENIGID